MVYTRTPANIMSTARRKRLFGVGINDAPYNISQQENGRTVFCPLYMQWKAMLQRCYCPRWKARYPTYQQCSVVPEWHRFSVFMAWAEQHAWQNKHLDKDLIQTGNKQYGPDLCLWVSPKINKILLSCDRRRGPYPVGVSLLDGKYLSRLSKDGKSHNLGSYTTVEEAADVFIQAKARHVRETALQQQDPLLAKALTRIASEIASGTYYN